VARHFAGGTDLISVSGWIGADPQTLAFWFRTSTAGSAGVFPALGGRFVNNGPNGAGILFYLTDSATSPANALSFELGNTTTSLLLLRGSANINDGNWHHVAAVWSAVSSTAPSFLYIDGVQAASGTPSATLGLLAGVTVLVGGNNAFTNTVGQISTFTGDVADFMHWTNALSASEIAGLAKGIRPHWKTQPNSLDLLLPLDGLVSPEPDLSGNTQTTTVTGTSRTAVGPPFGMSTRMAPSGLFVQPPAPPPTIPVIVSYNVM
jgi:hypothetical protein